MIFHMNLQVVGNQQVSVLDGILGILIVEPWNPAVDGALNEDNFGRKLKARGYHYTKHQYEPGMVQHEHAHEEHRKEAVLSGQLKFSMMNKEVYYHTVYKV